MIEEGGVEVAEKERGMRSERCLCIRVSDGNNDVVTCAFSSDCDDDSCSAKGIGAKRNKKRRHRLAFLHFWHIYKHNAHGNIHSFVT